MPGRSSTRSLKTVFGEVVRLRTDVLRGGGRGTCGRDNDRLRGFMGNDTVVNCET